MNEPTSKDPLEGKTLEMLLNELVTELGWEELGADIKIRCFTEDPSISSSLTFLRRTPWARAKVERLYRRRLRIKAREEAKAEKAAAEVALNPASSTDEP